MIKSIGDQIGKGYFGNVFAAEDAIRGTVAVKVLKKQPKHTDEAFLELQENLLREGQRLAVATHDNVVQVYYVQQNDRDGTLHLVMEYCEGGSIASLHEKGPMAPTRVREVATSVAMGLEAIHARGMIHRDIKPGNILVGKNGTIKLGDFGLVTDKIIYGYASVGDYKYAPHVAKEVWNGIGTSIKSDVWALGMTIYRLLHGADWYERFVLPLWSKIKDGGLAHRLLWLPHVTPAWRRFVRKCMHDSTASRYQTAGAVLNGLAHLPVNPTWDCSYAEDVVSWSAVVGTRRIQVAWHRPDDGPNRWEAHSLPLGKGNRRALGGSTSLPDLDKFFERWAR